MATKLGQLGILDILIAGDTANFKRATKDGATDLEKMGAVARSTVTSVAKFTAAVGAAGAAIFAWVRGVSAAGDQFAKMSAKVGASVEFLSAFAHAASLGGVSTEQMEKAIGRMTRTMSDASNGLATARRSFDDLDVKVQETDGSLREVPDVLLEVADRIAGMKDETKQAALAQEIFGRAGLDMLPVLKQGSAAIREQMEEARRLGIVWSTEAAKQAEEFNDNVERLGRTVEGLSIKLAGPLIQALGEASRAMLEAQRRGQGFFGTIAQGIRSILTGDDTTKWQRQFVNATDTLLRAQNELDRARHVVRSGAASGISASIDLLEKRLADAQAEVNRLLGIKDIVTGEETFGKPPKPGAGGTRTTTPTKPASGAGVDKELEEAFKQGEAAEGAFERVLAVAQARRDLDEEERARAKAHADEMTRIELEAAMQQGEIVEGAAERDAAVREAMYEIARQQREREKQANAQFWDNLAGLMNTGSKKMFELGKVAALGQAAVKGSSAVMSAWEAGMSVGGPWAPVVAAAYAAAAGLNALNLMNNIRSQQFGGGGGTPVHQTQGASGVSPVGAGGGAQQQAQGQSMTHIVKGLDPNQFISGRQLRELLNEGTRDGDRWVFA